MAILIFSISASFSLFSLALLFWNHILTCVSVRFREEENSALSAMERYCLDRNFRSRAKSCWVVKGVLGLRLLLCFRSVHFTGNFGNSPGSEKNKLDLCSDRSRKNMIIIMSEVSRGKNMKDRGEIFTSLLMLKVNK